MGKLADIHVSLQGWELTALSLSLNSHLFGTSSTLLAFVGLAVPVVWGTLLSIYWKRKSMELLNKWGTAARPVIE